MWGRADHDSSTRGVLNKVSPSYQIVTHQTRGYSLS